MSRLSGVGTAGRRGEPAAGSASRLRFCVFTAAVTVVAASALSACAEDLGPDEVGPSGPPATGVAEASSAATPDGSDAAATPAATAAPEPTPTPVTPPSPLRAASAAGGACHLLDYATLYEHLGLAFDVAAARSHDDAHACVLRATTAPLPNVVLTVVPTSADLESFELDLTPEDAEEVERLGQIGYLAELVGGDDRGPGLEVGWLSADERLVTLALTLPDGEDPTAYAEGLIEVARTVDRRRI